MKTETNSAATVANEWKPEVGKPASWGGVRVTVWRIHKGGTCTVKYWGKALLEGKYVTQRGVVTKNLSRWIPAS